MGVPLSAAVTLALLFLLSVGLNEQVAEGCSCAPRHPQQVFCASDVVIRAKIIGQEMLSYNNINSQEGLIAHNVEIIKLFKGKDYEDTEYIYSSQTSCGAALEDGDYLLSGKAMKGVIVFDLCDLVKPWNSLSSAEKQNLNMYQTGCDCEISHCTGASCLIKMHQKKCLIRVKGEVLDDEEALQSTCLPSSDGSCSWSVFGNNNKQATKAPNPPLSLSV